MDPILDIIRKMLDDWVCMAVVNRRDGHGVFLRLWRSNASDPACKGRNYQQSIPVFQ